MVAVNYFAPWLLTRELLPTLTKTPGARIVNVGSEASRRHGVLTLPEDLTETTAFTARGSSPLYGKSKLLDIMFTLELARRIEGTGVTANVLDPGFNVTGLGRELGFAAPLEKILTHLHIGDPRRGGRTHRQTRHRPVLHRAERRLLHRQGHQTAQPEPARERRRMAETTLDRYRAPARLPLTDSVERILHGSPAATTPPRNSAGACAVDC